VTAAPASEYAARLAARRASLAALNAADARFGSLRLVTFGAAALLAWLAWGPGVVHAGWLAVPVAAFAALVIRHDRVIRRRDAAARAVDFYQRGLARIEDRWSGGGESGSRLRPRDHLYADDLDLFGAGSLFELLSLARTGIGEDTLASWLLTAADAGEVAARHQAVRELTPALDLRERLAQAGTDVRAAVLTEALVAWAGAPPAFRARWLQPVAWIVTLASVGSLSWWAAGGPGAPAAAALLLVATVHLSLRGRLASVLHGADRPVRDLDVLAHALAEIENGRFEASRLAGIRERVVAGGSAAAAIRRLHRLSEMHDWQHNMLFAAIAPLLLWGPHLALAIERWRARHGRHVAVWLHAVGEMEAFSSLSAFAFEHPDAVFPELLTGNARFDGTDLRHPLLPGADAVPNSVRLDGDARLIVVSGSNMSGKSTLLRTVGINTVLALAGAPVRASALRLTPLAVGATLRIQDSLQEGRSRFYAEITRIRLLADRAGGTVPLLFLLDELFHGTNSRDRLVGAAGVLQALIDRGAIGLVTTHDLALTGIVDQLAPHARNVHFEDTFEQGTLRFDYRMRPGPVTRSNALALMRAVGLDVPDDAART